MSKLVTLDNRVIVTDDGSIKASDVVKFYPEDLTFGTETHYFIVFSDGKKLYAKHWDLRHHRDRKLKKYEKMLNGKKEV